MNLLKIARPKAIPRNRDNRDFNPNMKKEYTPCHVTTSPLDVRDLVESDIPGKNTFHDMNEMEILQDVCNKK